MGSSGLLSLPAAAVLVLLLSSAPLVAVASEPLNPEGNAVRQLAMVQQHSFDCPSGF
jgi:hypothetical protein